MVVQGIMAVGLTHTIAKLGEFVNFVGEFCDVGIFNCNLRAG